MVLTNFIAFARNKNYGRDVLSNRWSISPTIEKDFVPAAFTSTTTFSLDSLFFLYWLIAAMVALLVYAWKRRYYKVKPLADDKNPKGKDMELITGLSFKKLEDGEVISESYE